MTLSAPRDTEPAHRARFRRAQAIFEDVCELDAKDRTAAIAQACGGDTELRGEVERLLAHDAQSFALDEVVATPSELPKPTIPGFTLGDSLGEGGMGVVYRAEQHQPRRTVALKVVRAAVVSSDILKRFERETELLARLQHQGIGQIYEAGRFTAGAVELPYFAMELVEGAPLTAYIRSNSIPRQACIQLLARICDAVDHAHRRGVLHRDLKPGNILVTDVEGVGQPKILDFGIARTLNGERTEATVQTLAGQVIGTLSYMSPEQFADETELDGRCDVYALGVIAYEILGGALPLDVTKLSLVEAATRIRNRDPGPLGRIDPSLRGDVETIVMKCLEKEPDRRYASAAELAADWRRYLAHEPIQARRPSTFYTIRKFSRRNRAMVVGVAGIFLLLVVGIVGLLVGLSEVRSERARFDSLAQVRDLASLKADAQGYRPAWPNQIQALRAWQGRWRELLASIPRIRTTIDALRASAAPFTTTESQAFATSEAAATRDLHTKLAAIELAHDVAAGRRTLPEPKLSPAAQGLDPSALLKYAQPLVGLKRTIFGRELEGLAALQRLVEDSPQPDPARLEALAAAQVAVGLDKEARSTVDTMLAATPPRRRYYFASAAAWTLATLAHRQGPLGQRELQKLRNEIRAQQLDLAAERPWRLADGSDRFLLRELLRLLAAIERYRLEAELVQRRTAWASSIEELSIRRFAERWAAARAALASPDGENASKLYAHHKIDLQPQMGLVPLGKNPRTGLWEFYHLRSAWDPRGDVPPERLPIPKHDPETGAIRVDEGTGIVFALIPGGTFTMGAQRSDAAAPGYDKYAHPDENPVHDVTLEPYFLARHELTQGQWKRLGDGTNPSRYTHGFYDLGPKQTATDAHPVERVTRPKALEFLGWHGLTLPTEAQWEYACRAGSRSRYWRTQRTMDMQGAANVLDLTAKRFTPWKGDHARFEDGYVTHAPVDRLLPNPWGLFHIHGNVYEWCRDDYINYKEPARDGDGLRVYRTNRQFKTIGVVRGGAFQDVILTGRVSCRTSTGVTFVHETQGARAARPLRKD